MEKVNPGVGNVGGERDKKKERREREKRGRKKRKEDMGYSTDLLRERINIWNKKDPTQTGFGGTTQYELAACGIHANVTWLKGMKRLAEVALDDQDTVMFRMRWNNIVNRDSRIEWHGTTYQIQSMHADKYDDTIQITATEILKST